jgi:hypothetical protein
MAVDVRRDGVRRVAQVFRDDLGVSSGRQQEAGRGVPKGVQCDAAEAGSLREYLEAPQHVAALERCTDLGGEGQTMLLPGGCTRHSDRRAPVTASDSASPAAQPESATRSAEEQSSPATVAWIVDMVVVVGLEAAAVVWRSRRAG